MKKTFGIRKSPTRPELKMPSVCAWCGSADVIGKHPVVIDRSRVVGLNFESLKYEDCLDNYCFPICARCMEQIKHRRTLDNHAIQAVVMIGLLLTILLSFSQRNIGFAIFISAVIAVCLFCVYLLLKTLILSWRHFASEQSWGRVDGDRMVFHNSEFQRQWLGLKKSPKKKSFIP